MTPETPLSMTKGQKQGDDPCRSTRVLLSAFVAFLRRRPVAILSAVITILLDENTWLLVHSCTLCTKCRHEMWQRGIDPFVVDLDQGMFSGGQVTELLYFSYL